MPGFLEYSKAWEEHFTSASPPYPSTLQLEITNRCNLKCGFCPRQSLQKAGVGPVDITADNLNELSPILTAADAVELTGFSEALCHPDPLPVFRAFRDFNLAIYITTNGQAPSPELLDRIVGEQLADQITFSIDAATQKTYRKLRGGSFGRVLENVQAIKNARIKYRREYPKTWFSFLAMRSNIAELSDFIKLASGYGVEKVIVQHIVENEQYKGQSCLSDPEWLLSQMKKARSVTDKFDIQLDVRNTGVTDYGPHYDEGYMRPPVVDPGTGHMIKRCPFPWEHTFIRADGSVNVCAMVWNLMEMGNIKTDSFDSVWKGQNYQEIRQKMSLAAPPVQCGRCGYVDSRRPMPIDQMKSTLFVGEATAPQIGRGWHPAEKCSDGNHWRWTKRKATVFLRNIHRPTLVVTAINHPDAPMAAGRIRVSFHNGDSTEPAAPAVTFPFAISGSNERPMSIKLPDVKCHFIKVDIELDKTWNPGGPGRRELGLLVKSVGLVH